VSESTGTKRSRLWARFRDKAFRDAFVASHLSTNIAGQIYAMREARGWTQEKLADTAHMAQARISLMEDPSYQGVTLSTLKRLASAFDVGLAVRFVPFSELLEWSTSLTSERLAVPSYDADKLPAAPLFAQVSSGSSVLETGVTASASYGTVVSMAGDGGSSLHRIAA
jgi:transcriptional regulator with XRE-family HTH domain